MPLTSATTDPSVDVLAIVGVGLLGGSVAMAAKARGLVRRIVGIGRSAAKLEAAAAAGVIDDVATDITAVSQADLIVICTPVDRLADDILAAAEHSAEDATITDVGSIKESIVQRVAGTSVARKYVPAHPLAGSEQTGWQAGSAQLFQDRLCVLTPFEGMDHDRLRRVEAFWQALGMRTRQVSPDEHDRLLALTSHLPHVVASSLATQVGEHERPFAATGFRDTTRIAAGDPAVWAPILLGNVDNLIQAIELVQTDLSSLKAALRSGDASQVACWLDEGRRNREAFDRANRQG
jgi:prephenate dehydrogenase